MRKVILSLVSAAALFAADADVTQSNLVTSKHTPTANAPAFGTPSYFKRVWSLPAPKVELKNPIRLAEFVQSDKLELSLRNYIDLVLANNTDVQIERLSIETPRNAILRGYGVFDPNLIASFNATRRMSPATDLLAGAETLSTLNQPFSMRVTQVLPTGTQYNLGFDTTRTSTNNAFQNWNPAHSSNLAMGFSQPLLRNRGGYITRLPITIARSRLRQTEFNIENRLLAIVTQAENAYWDVIFARENLKVQEQNLSQAETLMKRSRRELELGAISELDIYQPEAQYKNAELSVTQARFRLQAAEDALRRQISADLDPQIRTLPIVLTEDIAPPVQTALDREALVERALRQRPDLRAVRQTIDVDDLTIQSTANALRPDLSLTAQYGSAGRGGNFIPRSGTLNPTTGLPFASGSVIPGGFGDALDQIFGFGFPTYQMGLTLRLPLRDRRASADYADAVVSKRLNTLRARSQEQQARLDVLNAITEVERSRASVELARVALDLSQKRLDAENKKFELGTTTIFFVLDAQTQFIQSQSNLVNQTVQFRRNLTTLQRVTGDLLAERNITIQ